MEVGGVGGGSAARADLQRLHCAKVVASAGTALAHAEAAGQELMAEVSRNNALSRRLRAAETVAGDQSTRAEVAQQPLVEPRAAHFCTVDLRSMLTSHDAEGEAELRCQLDPSNCSSNLLRIHC